MSGMTRWAAILITKHGESGITTIDPNVLQHHTVAKTVYITYWGKEKMKTYNQCTKCNRIETLEVVDEF